MTDEIFITGTDPEIGAAMEELMPIIDQRLAQAAGNGRRVTLLLFARVEEEGGASVAVNNDDPRDVVKAVMIWGRVMEERIAEWVRRNCKTEHWRVEPHRAS